MRLRTSSEGQTNAHAFSDKSLARGTLRCLRAGGFWKTIRFFSFGHPEPSAGAESWRMIRRLVREWDKLELKQLLIA